jgi:hypothetical protein
MNVLDCLSVLGRLFPRLTGIALVVMFVGFPATSAALLEGAVKGAARAETKRLELGLRPMLRREQALRERRRTDRPRH